MKVFNKKMCVVILLVLIEISSLFLMYKSNSNKEIKLENVENKEVVNNGLAIMIEQTNGTYSQYTTTNTWPSDTTYVLNTLKSGCIDNKGNKVENGMIFDKQNRKIIVNTNKTSNCYAYFTRSAQYKVEHAGSVWNSILTNDGYRYYGDGTTVDSSTDPKNYVCFGTQNKSECVSNSNKYMYRIIGMFQEENGNGTINVSSDYHLKLIKKVALNTAYQWHNDRLSDVNWSQSDLYKGLNGNYYLNNPEYSYMQDNYWYSKVTNWKWSAVNTKTDESNGLNYNSLESKNIYLDELNRSGKPSTSKSLYDITTAKIGLMYVSDYQLAMGSNSINYTSSSNYNDLKKSWMFLGNNTSNSFFAEWTIARAGNNGLLYTAWEVASYFGNANINDVSNTDFLSRPVFYLNSDVVICAGSGTSTDPYILG